MGESPGKIRKANLIPNKWRNAPESVETSGGELRAGHETPDDY
jgi:hypothetical protein